MGTTPRITRPLNALIESRDFPHPCYARRNGEDSGLTYSIERIAKTQHKRDHKATLLESVRSGHSEPSHGMTKEDAVTILIQDIADYDAILARLRRDDDR